MPAAVASADAIDAMQDLDGFGCEFPVKMSTLAEEQVFALAMARHPRLGATSRAAVLDDDLLRAILGAVQSAHKELVDTKRIVAVCVKTGDLVDRVMLYHSDGSMFTTQAVGNGWGNGMGGRWRRPMHLAHGEYLTTISGGAGDALDSICFTTNLGQQARFAGRLDGGSDYTYHAAQGHEITGLCFLPAPQGWLHSLTGIECKPSPWTSTMAGLLLAHPSQPFAVDPSAPFVHRVGALEAGHDLERRVCTFDEAKAHAISLGPACAGFTFHGVGPKFRGVAEVFFKDNRNGNNDWRWQTHLKNGWAGADGEYTDWPDNEHDDDVDDDFDVWDVYQDGGIHLAGFVPHIVEQEDDEDEDEVEDDDDEEWQP